MKKFRVMTVLGTRPEIIRLAEVIKKCDIFFDHLLVHTGQNWDYTLNEIFFKDLELRKPDYFLKVVGKDLGETIGNIIAYSYALFVRQQPDALLVLGDTNSALCTIAAKRLKIPIFHMEAGNRCFDLNVPEEINRRLVDHISDINLPYTEHSRRYLLDEGFRKDHIIVTGSPMPEVLFKYKTAIESSNILKKLHCEPKKYIVVSAHREENIDIVKNFDSLVESLNTVAEHYKLPVIYSTHPRSMNKIKSKKVRFNKLVQNAKPFGFIDYNCLQKNAFCVLSDSGTLSEESSILGFPAVLLRTSTERPEVLDKGSIIIGGVKKETMIQSIECARKLLQSDGVRPKPADYSDTNVSSKVVAAIQSFIPLVNKRVWDK